MEFQKKQLTQISQGISGLLSDPEVKNKKLIYTLVKNTKVLEIEVEAIAKGFDTNTEEYTEFTGKLRDVYQKYGEVDEQSGQIKTTEHGIVLKEDVEKEDVEKEITDLETKYKSAIDERTKEVEAYNEILEETVDLPLTKIKFEDLPDEMTPELMYVLDDLISEPLD